jgi:hypothetical protein
MKKLSLIALMLLLAGCAHAYNTAVSYHAQNYQFHKHTIFIKIHWNIVRPDNNTVVAEGFVEPFNPDVVIHTVRLDLVGLDGRGKVVNSAEGMPRDLYIESPYYPASPFKISMKLTGKEKALTITGNYYYYEMNRAGRSEHIDFIP